MRKIDTYIIEKLKLNKDSKAAHDTINTDDKVLMVTLLIRSYKKENRASLQCYASNFQKNTVESHFKGPLKTNTNGYLQVVSDLYPNTDIRLVLPKEDGIEFINDIIINCYNIDELSKDKLSKYFDDKYINMVDTIPLFKYPKLDHIENTLNKLEHA